MDDYRGAFDPSLTLASWSRRGLGVLGREYMLFGHLLNRAALPHVHIKMGGESIPGLEEALKDRARKRVLLRVVPEHTSSWDHSKRGGVY